MSLTCYDFKVTITKQDKETRRIEKPGSLTVPITSYPSRSSLFTSQEAKKPEAPVTQTFPFALSILR